LNAARKATLATRDIRHFDGLDIDLVDPWTAWTLGELDSGHWGQWSSRLAPRRWR
jgi:hypothetical protein